MRAIVTHQTGESPVMQIEQRTRPMRQPGTTLIKMKAATINQLSNTIRKGGIGGTPLPIILGNEGAGIVEESDSFAKGSHVGIYGSSDLGITEDGLFQEWVVVDDWRLMLLPDDMDLRQGASITINYLTALNVLTRVGQVKAGDFVLISGATGSVGNALIQIAAAIKAKPIALVSSDVKRESALKSGAYAAINWTTQDVVAEVNSLTEGHGADQAFDPVGGELFSLIFNATRRRGRIISIGFTAGRNISVDLLDLIMSERVLEGYSIHNDTHEQSTEGLKRLSELAKAGALRPVIDSHWSMDEFEEGYRRLMSREAIGSIVLSLD